MKQCAIEWRMECHVNDHSFQFNGTGQGDAAAGTTELWLESTGFPEGFEPASCPCICNAPLTIGFARKNGAARGLWDVAGGQLHVEPQRAASIFDCRGVEVLHLTVSSVLTIADGVVQVANEMRGFSKLPRLSRNLTPFDEHIVPLGNGSALSALRFKLLAASGEILTGLTTVPYRWNGESELEDALVRRYEAIDVEWDGARRVHTLVTSSLVMSELSLARNVAQIHTHTIM